MRLRCSPWSVYKRSIYCLTILGMLNTKVIVFAFDILPSKLSFYIPQSHVNSRVQDLQSAI